MKNDSRNDELLMRLVRELPPRRAPATLQLRVANALGAGDATPPGYGYMQWPFPARGACLAICLALAVLTAYVEAWLPSPTLLIPAAWVDGALASAIALYAALFGLGALGYHALYRPR